MSTLGSGCEMLFNVRMDEEGVSPEIEESEAVANETSAEDAKEVDDIQTEAEDTNATMKALLYAYSHYADNKSVARYQSKYTKDRDLQQYMNIVIGKEDGEVSTYHHDEKTHTFSESKRNEHHFSNLWARIKAICAKLASHISNLWTRIKTWFSKKFNQFTEWCKDFTERVRLWRAGKIDYQGIEKEVITFASFKKAYDYIMSVNLKKISEIVLGKYEFSEFNEIISETNDVYSNRIKEILNEQKVSISNSEWTETKNILTALDMCVKMNGLQKDLDGFLQTTKKSIEQISKSENRNEDANKKLQQLQLIQKAINGISQNLIQVVPIMFNNVSEIRTMAVQAMDHAKKSDSESKKEESEEKKNKE